MGPGMLDGIDGLFKTMGWVLAFSVPLAIWKLIDIAIWVFSHISIALK